MKYNHIGIPTKIPRSGETYLEKFKLFATDHRQNPYGIQWMRYLPDSPLPEMVKNLSHVAFEVDNLEQALEGKEIIIQPNNPSEGVRVAFIVVDGAPVELIEFTGRKPEK